MIADNQSLSKVILAQSNRCIGREIFRKMKVIV